ncbi:MAG: GatB/YqeY domain-containing protein [Pseudomonadota bacterium]
MRRKIATALQEALEQDDALRIGTLRLILAALRDREASLGHDDGPGELDERSALALLGAMVRQREEAIATLEQSGRMELAERERDEVRVIAEFLPRPLGPEETAQAVEAAIAETGARSIRDVGRVMTALKRRYAGRMDVAAASALVKAALD